MILGDSKISTEGELLQSSMQLSLILQESASSEWGENPAGPKPLQAQMLVFRYIWQYHSKSYDNDTVYSSENGAAICTMVQRLSSPGRDSAAGPVLCPALLCAQVSC